MITRPAVSSATARTVLSGPAPTLKLLSAVPSTLMRTRFVWLVPDTLLKLPPTTARSSDRSATEYTWLPGSKVGL